MLSIIKITDLIVHAKITDTKDTPMYLEAVLVGPDRILGEIISIQKSVCFIQMYGKTGGLKIGDLVELKGELLSVELGPGLVGRVFDGFQQSLDTDNYSNQAHLSSKIQDIGLNKEKIWTFEPLLPEESLVYPGMALGFVQESESVRHYVLVPPSITGKLRTIDRGDYTIMDKIGEIVDDQGVVHKITMLQRWPIKIPRPSKFKKKPYKLFKTGQRVIDAMFPVLLGSHVTTSGPSGSGKTYTHQQITKWSEAQIIVYVGCGERGREITELSKLENNQSSDSLFERMVIIANPSNMPVLSRESSVYMGVTIAEFYRDMGYDVVLLTDSISRWAEALRETSNQISDIPSTEGFPTYLNSRVSTCFERAGVVETVGGVEGSITTITSVSTSKISYAEPVLEAALISTQVLLSLDTSLVCKQHFPAINWLKSYSLNEETYEASINESVLNNLQPVGFSPQAYQEMTMHKRYLENRKQIKQLLAQEESLLNDIKYLGEAGLNPNKQLLLEITKIFREDFLQQNGYDLTDSFCSFERTQVMLNVIVDVYYTILDQLSSQTFEDDDIISRLFDDYTKSILSRLRYENSVDDIMRVGQDLQERIISTFDQQLAVFKNQL